MGSCGGERILPANGGGNRIREIRGKRYHSLEAAVKDRFGHEADMVGKDRIHGGAAKGVFRLTTGGSVFLKTDSARNEKCFLAEWLGLEALRTAGKISLPKALGAGTDERRGFSFLLLEYIEGAPRIKTYWETFGHQLAELHRAECASFVPSADRGARYGFLEDNFIGPNPQKNLPKAKWVDFYRECRLLPQIRMAERYFDCAMRKKLAFLLEHLDSYLREPPFPSVLHGDLWSGNIVCGNDGRAWILDPAVYVGDFETDLGMLQLFGTFPDTFYAAYSEGNPIDRGYSQRVGLYHLYHLLNHLNLFGRMYLGSVAEVLDAYAR